MSTIILRVSITIFFDYLDRAIDDKCNTIKILCRDGRLCAGAGATKINFSK
jgi:T-complex protein 1 subunit theta